MTQPPGRPDALPPELSVLERRAADAALALGRIIAVATDGALRVAVQEAECPAQRAASCLIEPAIGDRVLVARVGDETFVLSVLDRLLPGSAVLSVPGAAHVTLAAPHLNVRAGEALALSGTREVAIDGASVAIRSGVFTLVGRLATFVADHLRTTARRRESVADHSAEQAGNRTVLVRETDVLEAGTRVETIAGISSTQAATAVMVAKEDLRFDGKRVTVG